MSRLVTGEFSTRVHAGEAVQELIRAGIPQEAIYVETEPPPAIGTARKARTLAAAEGERRMAGAETGMLVGGLFGLVGGLLVATISDILFTFAGAFWAMGWPFTSYFWSGALGLVVGLAAGGGIGAAIDRGLTRLGAGPARTQEECLVSLFTDDPKVELAGAILAHNRARHVLRA
jgi:hypothetical protein